MFTFCDVMHETKHKNVNKLLKVRSTVESKSGRSATPARIEFTREKNDAAHPQVQLNCCAKSFPNNGDNFGLASDGVLQGYREQKALHFCSN